MPISSSINASIKNKIKLEADRERERVELVSESGLIHLTRASLQPYPYSRSRRGQGSPRYRAGNQKAPDDGQSEPAGGVARKLDVAKCTKK